MKPTLFLLLAMLAPGSTVHAANLIAVEADQQRRSASC